MINQAGLDSVTAVLALGAIAIVIFLVILVLIIVIALKIYKWAIEKEHGSVSSLGQLFVTLIIAGIASMVVFFLAGFLGDSSIVYVITLVVSILIQLWIISKRHNMSMGQAFVAVLLAMIVLILVVIVFAIIFTVVIVGILLA